MTLELNPAVVRLVWDHMMCFSSLSTRSCQHPLKCEFYCHQIGLERVKNSIQYEN